MWVEIRFSLLFGTPWTAKGNGDTAPWQYAGCVETGQIGAQRQATGGYGGEPA